MKTIRNFCNQFLLLIFHTYHVVIIPKIYLIIINILICYSNADHTHN
jgi:hypothetical protein